MQSVRVFAVIFAQGTAMYNREFDESRERRDSLLSQTSHDWNYIIPDVESETATAHSVATRFYPAIHDGDVRAIEWPHLTPDELNHILLLAADAGKGNIAVRALKEGAGDIAPAVERAASLRKHNVRKSIHTWCKRNIVDKAKVREHHNPEALLLIAAKQGDLAFITECLDSGAQNGYAAAREAIHYDQPAVLRKLLRRISNPDWDELFKDARRDPQGRCVEVVLEMTDDERMLKIASRLVDRSDLDMKRIRAARGANEKRLRQRPRKRSRWFARCLKAAF